MLKYNLNAIADSVYDITFDRIDFSVMEFLRFMLYLHYVLFQTTIFYMKSRTNSNIAKFILQHGYSSDLSIHAGGSSSYSGVFYSTHSEPFSMGRQTTYLLVPGQFSILVACRSLSMP